MNQLLLLAALLLSRSSASQKSGGGGDDSSASTGDIFFTLVNVPETWTGNIVGMVNPRDSPTHEVPVEFAADALNFTASVVHANSTNTAGDGTRTLDEFVGYELDLFVQHGDTLWPCVSATGPLATNNLHISSYSTAVAYTVEATYTQNRIGEWYFSCAGRKDGGGLPAAGSADGGGRIGPEAASAVARALRELVQTTASSGGQHHAAAAATTAANDVSGTRSSSSSSHQAVAAVAAVAAAAAASGFIIDEPSAAAAAPASSTSATTTSSLARAETDPRASLIAEILRETGVLGESHPNAPATASSTSTSSSSSSSNASPDQFEGSCSADAAQARLRAALIVLALPRTKLRGGAAHGAAAAVASPQFAASSASSALALHAAAVGASGCIACIVKYAIGLPLVANFAIYTAVEDACLAGVGDPQECADKAIGAVGIVDLLLPFFALYIVEHCIEAPVCGGGSLLPGLPRANNGWSS